METVKIVLVVIAVLAGVGAVWLRSRKPHTDRIIPEVEAAGLSYLSSRIPRLWESGPFPKFRVRVTFVDSQFGPLDGEYEAVRVVRVLDRRGQTHTVWVRLTFTAFALSNFESRPDLGRLGKGATKDHFARSSRQA